MKVVQKKVKVTLTLPSPAPGEVFLSHSVDHAQVSKDVP